MRKYTITEECATTPSGAVVHRIRALIAIPQHGVGVGDMGGYIETEENLTHFGDCWVGDNAMVYENARVSGDACILGYAVVSGNARVEYRASVGGSAKVNGNACITGKAAIRNQATVTDTARVSYYATVYGDSFVGGQAALSDYACVYGCAVVVGCTSMARQAQVGGFAKVGGASDSEIRLSDYASVYGRAQVLGGHIFDNARVGDAAIVRDKADVHGNAEVVGRAVVAEHMHVIGRATTDLTKNLVANIYAQTLQCPVNGKVLLFKSVARCDTGEYCSLFDRSFKYRIGEVAEALNCDDSKASCASGLHCSHLRYWDGNGGNAYLAVEVDLADIITVQEGKVRCKRLKVLEEVTL